MFGVIKGLWKSELFTPQEVILCGCGGAGIFFGLRMLPSGNNWALPSLLMLSCIHLWLVAKAVKCRSRWRFDWDSYMDFMCLFGGILVSPIVCLAKRRNARDDKSD